MVKLVSLSYADTGASPQSAPTSPGRSFTSPILSAGAEPTLGEDRTMSETIKTQMMSEWTRENVIAAAQETSKSVSLNGSRSGTNATGPRNFLAVNGTLNNGGTNSGTNSPGHHHHAHSHRSRPNSTYGLVGGLGAIQKIRKESGHSPSPPSESSRASVTRVDQLKRILSDGGLPAPVQRVHSDASSDSMVSYDFTASEVSFNPGQQNLPPLERSVSSREPRSRSRSKSNERTPPDNRARPLTSHPVMEPHAHPSEHLDGVPPVPPLPAGVSASSMSKSRSVKKGAAGKREPASSLFGESEQAVDLVSLLKGIGGNEKGVAANPPY